AADVARIGDDRLRAVLDAMSAAIALDGGELVRAGTIYDELVRLGDRLGDLAVLATGLGGIAKVERLRGKLRSAEKAAAEAQRFSEISGDDRILQDILGISSRIAIEVGNLDKASSLIDRRRMLTRRIRDVIGELEADVDRARLYATLGDFNEATLIV